MRRESLQMMLPVACATAYDFLIEYRNDPLWRSELSGVEVKSGKPGEPGVVYTGRLDWNGMVVAHELELVACGRPSEIRVRTESPNLSVEVVYGLLESGGERLLTAEYALRMDGPLLLLEPFGWAILMGWARDDLPRLPAALST